MPLRKRKTKKINDGQSSDCHLARKARGVNGTAQWFEGEQNPSKSTFIFRFFFFGN